MKKFIGNLGKGTKLLGLVWMISLAVCLSSLALIIARVETAMITPLVLNQVVAFSIFVAVMSGSGTVLGLWVVKKT